jgi:energy-coupling factor transporter ATP-binding protein EcfA2
MDFIDTYMRYAMVNGGSDRFNLWAGITSISAALERRVWLDDPSRGWLYANLYTVLVGPPGSGKTTAIKIAERFLKSIQYAGEDRKIYYVPVKITPAGLIEEIKHAYRAYKIGRFFVPQSPVCAIAHELHDMFTDIGGGSVIPELLTYYDPSGTLKPEDFKVIKKTRGYGIETLVNPSVVLLAGTTTKYLSDTVTKDQAALGITARIVFVYDGNFYEDATIRKRPSGEDAQVLTLLLTRIFHMQGEIRFAKSAWKAWHVIVKKSNVDRKLYHGTDSIYEHYHGRKLTQIQKLAMISSASRSQADYLITTEDLERACTWIELLEQDMPKAFGMTPLHKDPLISTIILKYVPIEPARASESEILNAIYKTGLVATYNTDLKGAFEYLLRAGLIFQDGSGNYSRKQGT